MRHRKAAPPGADGQESVARPPLRTLFPAVTQLRVELDFVAESSWPLSGQVHILHPPSAASFRYPCPVAGCSGHFDLQDDVMELLRKVEDTLSSIASCSGVRPQDRSTGKLCGLQLKYRLQATYESRRQTATSQPN